MDENIDWATLGVKEVPCWRDGMSVEEYEIEYIICFISQPLACSI